MSNVVRGKIPKGSKFSSKSFGEYEVLEDKGALEVRIRFLESGYEKVCQRGNVRRGGVKDSYYPSVYGKGWLGEGKYSAKVKGKVTKQYHVWSGLMHRCYGESGKGHWKTYRENTEVSEEFLDFQKFSTWFDDNYVVGWDLDKDILSSLQGVNLYSRETCIFLPPRINKCLIGQPKIDSDLPVGVTAIQGGGYTARLSIGDIREYLGYFNCPDKAFLKYKETKLKLISSLVAEYGDVLPTTTKKAILSYKILDRNPKYR